MSSERRRTHVGKRYSSNGGYAGFVRVITPINFGLVLRPDEKRNIAEANERRRRLSRETIGALRSEYAKVVFGTRMAWLRNQAKRLGVSADHLRLSMARPPTIQELDAAHHTAMVARAAARKVAEPPAAQPNHIDDDEPIGGW